MYKKACLVVSSGVLFVLTCLWLSSYTHYTSFGVDHDLERGDRVLHVFGRIRWTGYGSFWVGYGSTWKARNAVEKLERFDPAAVFFRRATEPLSTASFWNRAGFWFIHASQPRPTLWIGVPSWLPVLLLGLLLFWGYSRAAQTAHKQL